MRSCNREGGGGGGRDGEGKGHNAGFNGASGEVITEVSHRKHCDI